MDPDAGDDLGKDEEHAQAWQELILRARRDGSTDVRGRLGPELAAALTAAHERLRAVGHPVTDDQLGLPQR